MTLVESIKEFEANFKWIGVHYEELKAQYPDQWIAVWKEEVVGQGNDLLSVREELKKRFPEDHTHIPIEYIGTEDIEFILESR